MATDTALVDINIPSAILRKLAELEIKSLRQLYARLQHEDFGLREYLQLSKADFSQLLQNVENIIRNEHPEALLPSIHPRVNRTGVPLHRFRGPVRSKH
ncbi:MAG TPA: hypothetical protein VIA62_03600 [Thermoanaerobaculia bacterium]|jgi:hypothetical protein|nr:hypothetical protein [Thermoanaerobaculia bacterium]